MEEMTSVLYTSLATRVDSVSDPPLDSQALCKEAVVDQSSKCDPSEVPSSME